MGALNRLFTALAPIAVAGALSGPLLAEQSGQQAAPKPKAYKIVAVQPAQPVNDASYQAFRKQLADIAARKDRAALAKLIARNFFWMAGDKDVADKSKPGIETLAKAIGLDNSDGIGWQILASFLADPTGDHDPDDKELLCAPGDPQFDTAAADALAEATGTDPQDWVYPSRDGIEVHADPDLKSRVVGKLGMHLVWVYPDESPASAVYGQSVRIVMPSGALGFVAVDSLLTLEGDQLCYRKEGGAWKIAGLRGGDTESAN